MEIMVNAEKRTTIIQTRKASNRDRDPILKIGFGFTLPPPPLLLRSKVSWFNDSSTRSLLPPCLLLCWVVIVPPVLAFPMPRRRSSSYAVVGWAERLYPRPLVEES